MGNYKLILFIMLSFLSCKNSEPLETVESVDINRYLGEWYEIARLPNSFEKGLECVTATYSIKDNGKIEVLNKGFSIENKGENKTAKGVAWVPKTQYPGRLKVSFFRPFSGKYYIIALDKDYKYALVGDPSRKYLWVLSRTKILDDSIYTNLLEVAQKHKFDISTIIKVNQDCKH
jgi:apolipoprotein D and lipocalin family protein